MQWINQLAVFRPGISPDEQLTLLKTYIEEFKLNKDRRLYPSAFHYPSNSYERFRTEFLRILEWPKDSLMKYYNDEIAERKGIPAKIDAQVKTLYDIEFGKSLIEQRKRKSKMDDDLPY